jgi:NAD(P)-dependent dehydrogenase (short-subunit alcohol dehydrogenase family)
MKIEGCTALVTGANRGLGKAFAQALLAARAAQVFAAARDPAEITYSGVTPIKLDVTSDPDVESSAHRCKGVNLLINNAGAMLLKPVLANGADVALRRETEVNVFGVHRMMAAFNSAQTSARSPRRARSSRAGAHPRARHEVSSRPPVCHSVPRAARAYRGCAAPRTRSEGLPRDLQTGIPRCRTS